MPNAATLASEFVPQRQRALAVTIAIVCVPVGGMLAAAIAEQVLPVLGWRTLFVIGGVLPLAIAGTLIVTLPESPRYLARHADRRLELDRLLRRLGHHPSPDATYVDASERGPGHVSVRRVVRAGPRSRHARIVDCVLCESARGLLLLQLGAGDARRRRIRRHGKPRAARLQSGRRDRRVWRRRVRHAVRIEADVAGPCGRRRRGRARDGGDAHCRVCAHRPPLACSRYSGAC